jgi:hypothetical protein
VGAHAYVLIGSLCVHVKKEKNLPLHIPRQIPDIDTVRLRPSERDRDKGTQPETDARANRQKP